MHFNKISTGDWAAANKLTLSSSKTGIFFNFKKQQQELGSGDCSSVMCSLFGVFWKMFLYIFTSPSSSCDLRLCSGYLNPQVSLCLLLP